jgi:hypothetical protein
LDCLKNVGFLDEEITRARREIEEKGWSVVESTRVAGADLESVILKCYERQRA